MKRLVSVCALMAALVLTAACSSVAPNAGEEAVLTMKPILFGKGGVVSTPVRTGRAFIALTTSSTIVNMQPQQVDIEFDDLMTSDGVPLDFHASVRFRIIDSVKLVREFGNDTLTYEDKSTTPGFFYRNIEQPFRTAVRNAVKEHHLNEMAITTSAADNVDQKVTQVLQEIIKQTGVPITLIDVTLGRANPPDAIKTQRIATAEQQQRQNTEAERKKAEEIRKGAEEARAAADAAYNYKMQLTPDQYLRLQTIQMQRDVCSHGGCYFGFSPVFTQPAVGGK